MFNSRSNRIPLQVVFGAFALLTALPAFGATPKANPAVAAALNQALQKEKAGRFADAVQVLTTALASARSPGDQTALEEGIANARLVWGTLLNESADYAGELDQFRQALAMAKKIGPESIGAEGIEDQLLCSIGDTYRELGQYNQALSDEQQALAMATKIGDKSTQEQAYCDLGNVYVCLGQYDKSLDANKRALTLAVKLGDTSNQELILGNTGIVYMDTGEYDKALDIDQQSLALATKIGDSGQQERDLGNIASVYIDSGHYDKALDYEQKALLLTVRLGDTSTQEILLGNEGVAYMDLGQYDKALDTDQQSLTLATKIGDTNQEEHDLGNIASVHRDLAQYGQALNYDQQSLALATKIGDKSTQEIVLGNIGILYMDLGEYDKALATDQQSLALAAKIGDASQQEHDIANIASVYMYTDQYDKALSYDMQSLALSTKIGDASAQEIVLGSIGDAYFYTHQYDKALRYDQQSLALATQIGDVSQTARDLGNIGVIYRNTGQNEKALGQYNQALLLQQRIGDLSSAGRTLGDLMYVEDLLKEPAIAIFYGKQAVNTYQTIRAGVANLDTAVQESYLATVEGTYRFLADLLIGEGRLPEAEQVLAMLKNQEATDFVQRDAALSPATLAVSFDPDEQAADTKSRQLEDPVISVGRQLESLKALKQRTPEQAAQVVALSGQLDSAQSAYDSYVATDLPREIAAAPDANRPAPADVSPIQQQLRAMGPGTVAVITLVEPDYLRLIVVTSQTQKAEISRISAADLRHLVGEWRTALQNPDIDPRPLGKQLAAAIIGPIQADLDGDDASTILFSLDDVLRYVPMAALYDGGHYLVEKYRVALFTGATLTAPDAAEVNWGASPRTLLALGVTRAHELPDLDTGKELSFPALPGVAHEIDEIARTKTSPDGILPGEALEDGQFTAQNLQLGLATGYPVVHIASHFELGSRDTTSFLLLGDGSALTLDKLFQKGGQVFQGVDLLTLSACQTGEDVASSDGHQFESLGMVAEAQGAQSILASLWPVSDASTPILMRDFYDKRANVAGMTKAEALRQAQIGLLRGQSTDTSAAQTATAGRGSEALPVQGSVDLPAFTADAKAPYAHPYYWAAFVLIGGWK